MPTGGLVIASRERLPPENGSDVAVGAGHEEQRQEVEGHHEEELESHQRLHVPGRRVAHRPETHGCCIHEFNAEDCLVVEEHTFYYLANRQVAVCDFD